MKKWCTEHIHGALRAWAIIGGAVMLAWEIYFIFSHREIPVAALLLLFTVWIVFGWLVLNHWSLRRGARAVELLNQSCDPEPLLSWTLFSLSYWEKRRVNYHFIAVCRLNLSAALNALGRFEEAERACLEIAPDKLPRLPMGTQILYWGYRCTAALNLGKLAEAETTREEGLRLFRGAKLSPKLKASCASGFDRMDCVLLFKQGRLDGLEERFLAQAEQADCLFSRVTAHAFLGYLAQGRGDETAAAEHLRYVVEHGNKLAIRAKAEELLKALK